ncbi:MAG: hypothetical protein PHI32_08020 [Dysgonamonadaceae bacterium]|nr:hypothetical protein [Dysgonamonadaceae bacterium]
MMTKKLETTFKIEDILFNLNMAIQNYNVRTEINDVEFHFIDLLNLDYPHDMSDCDWDTYLELEHKMIEHLNNVLLNNMAKRIIESHKNASLLELIIK